MNIRFGYLAFSSEPVFLGLLFDLDVTVQGTANPRNSRLHESQRRLYLNRILDHSLVGR